MLTPYIEKLIRRENLSESEAKMAAHALLLNDNNEQAASFLALLEAKGITAEELYAFVRILQTHMKTVHFIEPVIDVVGTGGDNAGTVNISTTTSLILGSMGVNTAKHGNVAATSKCGSADFIKKLGIRTDLTEYKLQESMVNNHYAYLYAPEFHPILKRVAPLRKALGFRTIFNLLGPLLNPARPEFYLIGVYDEKYLSIYADVLVKMKVKRALVVHGSGLDELNTLGVNKVIEVENGKQKAYEITPEELGLTRCKLSALQGGDAHDNQEKIFDALNGKKINGQSTGLMQTLTLNVGAALYITGAVKTIHYGVILAEEHLISGRTVGFIQQLERSVSVSTHNSYLQKIINAKYAEVDELKKHVNDNPTSDIAQLFNGEKTAEKKFGLSDAFNLKAHNVIAEVKRRSPSKGHLATINDPIELAEKYEAAGASAISVLTDKTGFDGSLDDLKNIVIDKKHNVAILRKDFLVDPVQIAESVAAGATSILLIVSVLKEKTAAMIKEADRLKIDALVEIHNEKECDIALKAGAKIIGINNRDLNTFNVETDTAFELKKRIPNDIYTVAESGIDKPELAQAYFDAGFNAVLIGEALVKSNNPGQFIQACYKQNETVNLR